MKAALVSLVLLACYACKSEPPAAEREAAVKKARAAFKALGGQLKAELTQGIRVGGSLAAAVDVCSKRAPVIAEQVSQAQGFSLGRSSHRLRNPNNRPPTKASAAAVKQYLSEHAGKKAIDAPVEATFEQGSWTVVAPIGVQPLCLGCHGNKSRFTAELQGKLSAYYPGDQAAGFELGELRGVFWATLPERRARALN